MNKQIRRLVLFVSLSIIISVCVSCRPRFFVLMEKREENPTLRINYWGEDWKNTALSARIKEAPPELIELLQIDAELKGYDKKPSSAIPPPELFQALSSIEEAMPENIKLLLEERLIGIFAVKELGPTGSADAVLDIEGYEKYGFIVTDVDVLLKRNANEWNTWRINSNFKPQVDGNVKLKMIIEEEENNNVVNSIRYNLLHEMGHILGMVSMIHPSWHTWKWYAQRKEAYLHHSFQKLSWKFKDDEIISFFDEEFSERKSIHFYSFENATLANEQIPTTYDNLRKHTNFPSLYAGKNMWEDFAESFVIYFHTVIDNRPWKIIIEQEGQPEMIIEPCWKEERCRSKKEFMERWFENPFSVNSF